MHSYILHSFTRQKVNEYFSELKFIVVEVKGKVGLRADFGRYKSPKGTGISF